jgi:hypothetical protein
MFEEQDLEQRAYEEEMARLELEERLEHARQRARADFARRGYGDDRTED